MLTWWHEIWFKMHVDDADMHLDFALQRNGAEKKFHLRKALVHVGKARERIPKAHPILDDQTRFVRVEHATHKLYRELLLSEMREEDRKFCQAMLDWTTTLRAEERKHTLTVMMAEFLTPKHQIKTSKKDMRVYFTQHINGAYHEVPLPLVEILTPYVKHAEGADNEATIKRLEEAVDRVHRLMPALLNPEL